MPHMCCVPSFHIRFVGFYLQDFLTYVVVVLRAYIQRMVQDGAMGWQLPLLASNLIIPTGKLEEFWIFFGSQGKIGQSLLIHNLRI